MQNFVSRLASVAGVLLTLGGCTDNPTLSDRPTPDLAPGAAAVMDAQVTPQGCVVGGICLLPPISGGACEPWMELDWDCSDGGGTCMSSVGDPTDPEEAVTVQGCPGGDGGGGGGPGGDGGTAPPPGGNPPGDPGTICPESTTGTCPDEPPPPDTCKTGEQIVDAPNVWGEFQELWLESKLKQVEKGGWVVSDGNSFRLIPFQNATFTACGIDVYESPPAGTVSIVHTHPWPLWTTNPCGYINTGTPSQEDINALQQTGLSTGYFLDDTGIGKFTATGGQTATRISRCGY
jgi:hypothetical protein